MHKAAEIGQLSIVKYFVERGDGVNIPDKNKVSIMQLLIYPKKEIYIYAKLFPSPLRLHFPATK